MTALGGRVGLDQPVSRRIYTQQGHQTNTLEGETVSQRRIRAVGLLLSALLSVEFVLYTVSLCSSKWLVVEQLGASQGLFSVCNLHDGLTACYTLPPWVGAYSLSWMFLAGSCVLSLAALLSFRLRGPAVVLLFNISSATLCVAALTVFLVSLEEPLPEMLATQYLGWTFYICCGNLLYTVVLSVALGLFHGASIQVEPVHAWAGVDLPVIAP
ncbi:uncharacterized protein LOC115551886 [Gadus morhua]|uniref:uncharacterized protein LOC115551886 n=1 Tax=Gadus morhua TaxID=8049 RepID=UPI0011B3EA22|nr:uncharacterized protein LOC115551886 [Gadus morhua]